ncbi:MAG: CDP-glucose 4,6-dehydratase [Eubacteriaceae bacterium]|nr:CDP-glucose 4,6-dehydratase [Eubacteriaceae bacterium]
MAAFSDAFKGKTVLVTGHTGFKGSWLCIMLMEVGARVVGYALEPYTARDNFVLADLSSKMKDIRGDIRDQVLLKKTFNEVKPDFVFHLAAQPIVRLSYEIPRETYEINVMGTLNVLECVRASQKPVTAVMITTDKCYENREQLWGYRENDALGGYDPYSSSKGCAEILISSWRNSFMNPLEHPAHGKAVASVRAGNVIGGGDWAKDRIIPDCIRAIEANKPIEIRSPWAIRPWEHVLEPLSGYLQLAARMSEDPVSYCEAWNFGPNLESVITVKDMAERIVALYGKGEVKDISTGSEPHEAKLLNLDISKAVFRLGWKPVLDIQKTLELTVDWYKNYGNQEVYTLCTDQIRNFYEAGDKA